MSENQQIHDIINTDYKVWNENEKLFKKNRGKN